MDHGRQVGSRQALVSDPAVTQMLWSRIETLQQPLASFERIKAIAVLPEEFSQAGGELTPTLKAKRTAIAQRYADVLRGLYTSATAAP